MRRYITILMMILLSTMVAQGQIKIGGNVYGGGNHAEVKGSTKVTVSAGDIGAVIDPENDMSDTNPRGRVFGGARMANVGGNTLVHIDGENASDYILINHVYGGNDIAGEIGTAANVGESLPSEVAGNPDGVDNTYNSYVHLSSGTDVHYTQAECNEYNTEHNLKSGDEGFRTTDDIKTSAKKIFIGQLFAGGNGDFDYTDENGDMLMDGDDYIIKERGTIIARSKTPFVRPELDKAYLDIQGGTIFFAYGGGNNATVKKKTVIHVDNPSDVVTHILANSAGVEGTAATYTAYAKYLANEGPAPADYTDLLSDDRIKKGMGIRMAQEHKESDEFQIGRLFGGNNLAAMDIMPTWNLQTGKIRNLYSGGNRGNMISPKGLLLEINPLSTNTHPLIVDNVYGGCRMADVKPTVNGEYVPCTNLEGYNFPNELSARTLVRGGDINNVYGGNDVTGSVYGGNAIGIYTTIRGDVYGGGNGSYAYTDNETLENDETYGDFYYPQPSGMTSGQALNAFRPNAEQVSIRLKGAGGGPTGYTVIKGSVFLGGNCASLATKKKNPMVELKIGSYVIADKVFLGNNGAGMVSEDVLKYYAGEVDEEGNFIESGGTKFSTLDLKDVSVFKRYMTGVAMPLKPNIVFDNTDNGDPANYEPFSSFVGSFYCGGNVGSMTIEGKETFTINQGLNIYEKFVGGCNNADVKAGTYNTVYQGGVIGTEDEQLENGYIEGGKIKDRIEINLENLTITPLRWNDTKTELMWNTQKLGKIYTAIEKDEVLKKGDVYYTSMPYSENTVASSDYTVKESDKFFKKLEDNVYINIATGTVLPVGSKYYTYSDTGKNTVSGESYTALGGEYIEEQDFVEVPRNQSDHQIRLIGGNVYGGCYESGHVNGNVIININQELLNRDKVFGTAADAIMGNPASGVEREDQRDDLMAVALSVFGAGCGEDTEVWGSTTVNHNNGYAFQIYGGGEEGMVGKSIGPSDEVDGTYNASTGEYSTNGKKYKFDTAYSSTVNLSGNGTASANEGAFSELAETEYIYGGGNEGDVCGNTLVNLGNGRVYDAFGGACDADILGHAEVYIGRQPSGSGGYKEGFPWVKDIVYGGNDFGGTIYGEYEEAYDFTKRVRNYATVKTQLHGYTDGMIPDVLKSSAYVEYLIGRVDTIFGGGYGSYDYTDTELYGVGSAMPKQHSSYVNIRPKDHKQNALKGVFGGGTGYHGIRVNDEAQDRSYVLIDIPDGETKFKDLVVFGAGSYNGVGMQYPKETTFAPGYNRDQVSAIIDLLNGEIGNAYGGSYNEGNTCRTVVNVPEQSTIKINKIFGGAFGTQILPPCDVIQAIVNYNNTSEKASVSKIYGGNNNERRALFTQVNISSPVWSDKTNGYLATVYGAGHGIDTWSEQTLVKLDKGAKVYEVYGGGEMGHVLNAESIQKYMQLYKSGPSPQISAQDPYWKVHKGDLTSADADTKTAAEKRWASDWKDAWKLGKYYEPNATYDNYFNAFADLRNTSLVYKADIDDRNFSAFSPEEKAKRQYIYSTNVVINDGAEVMNYAYGGGYGDTNEHLSGDVYGHTYIALLGGTVKKDIYAAGTAGAVNDIFGVNAYNASTNPYGFTASTTAYIKGGTCRNVYGGGWKGNVGAHSGSISDSPDDDIPGETHVVIGDVAGSSFTSGIPAVQRNVYGGGEGGAVFGKAYLTVNNGYVGYLYNSKGSDDASTTDFDERYEEKIEDDTKPSPNTSLEEAGCVFGGGYIDNSTVDKTYVTIYGGNIRNSVFGGGEIAAIGRGDMKLKTGGTDYELNGIYRPGKTNVKMYSGHVHRNVFGGGRGYDNLSGNGSLHDDGYVFGQTEVSIHGGQIGTTSGVADGDGNVFGGGDLGFVYSAYENADGTFGKGVKSGVRYNAGLTESDAGWNYQGYYYKHAWADDGAFVTVEVPTSYYTAEDSEVIAGTKQVGDVKTTKTERQFTEDCKVLVEPMCKVLDALNIDGTNYSIGDYVPIEKLNKLKDKNTDKDKWDCLDQTGIIIHNAVFAGGNAQSGSMTTGANTNTVFGNATASINDIFHRDLITLGTRHTGGLYGDGNLTLVDGYRELNITNYGTDYYSIAKEITIDAYHDLPDREAAYYELNYTCMKKCQDKNKTIYTPADPNTSGSKAATITADDMLDLFLVKSGDTYVSIQNNASGEYVQSGGTAVLVWNEIQKEWEPNSDAGFWKESGVLPVYAGRLMNSIQRADLCGIFGSRMVMQGAQDRVPEEVDFTNYTINRVREVSLNKMDSKISSDLAISEGDGEYYKKHRHGNYFGIYNVVNYLGALTSDVLFTDVRKTDNNSNDELYKRTLDDGGAYGTATYYDWKKENIRNKTRNNGNSHNKVALASGVYLELTTEESTGDDLYEKVWGPITGIVELDLINVSTGIGGGFVYAKNIHGIPSKSSAVNTTLTKLNEDAVTQWDYTYDATDDATHQKEWESSGNFVHSTQTIIDDCYNVSNRYYGDGKMPAHFWYIKGSTYVYDQYISAYTGQSNAFSEVVDIPLTIAAASHGKMKLLNVMPNRYAYYSSPGVPLGDGKKMIINGKTYYKNDPISYWDWYLLSNYEKELFVGKTYVNCITCKIDGVEYAAGTYVMTDAEFTTYKGAEGGHTYTNAAGEAIKDADDKIVDDDYIFRESNNVSHDEGYILTYEVNNPSKWDNWYTPKSNTTAGGKITLAAYEVKDAEGKALYEDGPTYRLKTSGSTMLGQSEYKYGDLIPEAVQSTYTTAYSKLTTDQKAALAPQATFEMAYIVKNKITMTEDGHEIYYNPGTTVSATFREGYKDDCEKAYICTKSIELTKDNVIYRGSKLKKSEVDDYIEDVEGKMGETYKGKTIDEIMALTVPDDLTAEKKKELIALATLRDDLQTCLVQAYYCTSEPAVDSQGNPVHYYYGGNYYESGHNYRGLEAWSSMSAADREKFDFNYDALDLLIDPDYTTAASGDKSEGHKYQYDSAAGTSTGADNNPAHYSLETAIDYTATYNGGTGDETETAEGERKDQKYMKTTAISGGKVYVGDELTREQFESLPNEQRHYSTISVKEAGITYYVVNTPFQIGSTPYAIGETISSETYKSLTTTEQAYVTSLTFGETDVDKNFYYCREAYTIETTHKVKSVKGSNTSSYDTGATVPIGAVISAESSDGYTGYSDLANEQRNFTIHGISPTETSTLYVSRESDIYDLSKEKIITVIYQYDYDETDTQGNVTPISERHVLNIHLTFKSGVPTVEDITPPDIILPGDKVTLAEPTVTPGAYEVTGYGWELFATQREAESHTNGVEYNPDFDKLYWYQDNYYVAYYAKSYLGRTYSNAVPVRVANYHDLADVMSDEDHHMYIDHKNVKRDPKIYINDYNDIRKNGLDLFKDLYDLSLVTSSTDGYTVTEGKITATSGSANSHMVGHALLSNQTRAERNLEFFLRTDIKHTDSWTPIGYNGVCDDPSTTDVDEAVRDNGKCFDGVLHGDGHTISGLDHSLFNHLCGEVYNLGVMGSFTGAGVAETGDGYVENCWISTSSTAAKTSKPVFGNPTKEDYVQIVNSYYMEENDAANKYTNHSGSYGIPTRKNAQAFYNGEVAYDLNGFYLYKRYNDGKKTATGVEYKYWKDGEDDPQTGYYADNMSSALCSSGYNGIKYVEDRFADGDYRYVGENRGVIPDPGTVDERHWIEVITNVGEPDKEEDRFSPIWPDDYIFFGQKLNYGYDVTEAHQEVPTAVARDGGRLSLKDNANRVYRAPAYYRSKVMGVAYFNPTAYLAQKEKLSEEQIAANEKAVEESRLGDVVTPREAYPSMTAIDFAGHNKQDEVSGTYTLGSVGTWFYQPLLDDDGLLSIQNCDETQNLLVYAPAESATDSYANQKTHAVLTSYFKEPEFVAFWDSVNTENRYTDGKIYKRVADATAQSVYGHLVQSNLKATNDHLLVDKQDFNAPFGYSFDSDRRMWYQRKPENYVDLTQGWEGISLPFTVELVTTDVKGELTHFYQGNTAGHEYWLREYKGNLQEQTSGVYKADFDPLAAGSKYKNYTNTFLWDYYYSQDSYLDKNDDEYQKKYYSSEYLSQCYPVDNYPYSKGGTPYIIGFPGKTYYEFDLSGNWTTLNRYRDIVISSPGKQIVTFASVKGGNIGVSDEETVKYINKEHVEVEAGVTANGYTFKPSYMNYNSSNLEVAEGLFVYLLDSDGASFKKTAAENVSITAFRPYFIGPAIPPASSRSVEKIIFGQSEDSQGVEEEHGDPTKEELNGGLRIWTKKDKIYVESSLKFTEDMRIVTPAGITVATFSVKPGQTVEVQADFSGMYIVHTLDGKYTKKVAVKK